MKNAYFDYLNIPVISLENLDVSWVDTLRNHGITPHKEARIWLNSIGMTPNDNLELFIERTIIGCAQQFNFWQDNPGMRSETVWEWLRSDYRYIPDNWNLYSIRTIIHNEVGKFIHENRPLYKAINRAEFWHDMNKVFNPIPGFWDPVYKKVFLVQYILTDLGICFRGWKNTGYGCIDYNLLIVFKYFGILDFPDLEWHNKIDLDAYRLKAYSICYHTCKVLNMTPSELDGYAFLGGRYLRKKTEYQVNIPKVYNETNY